MNLKKTSAALAVIASLVTSGAIAKAEEYKIGLLLPFSGVYAGLGSHIENGFNLIAHGVCREKRLSGHRDDSRGRRSDPDRLYQPRPGL